MKKRTSDRLSGIEQSATYILFDMVHDMRARGVSIIDLGGGEPDFATPQHIADAATSAIGAGWTHYTPSRGIPELLSAISVKLRHDNDIVADPRSDIVVTPSAKHGLFVSLMAILNPGDEIIIPTPSWVSYKAMVEVLGAKAVELPLKSENNFAIEREELAALISPHTRAILVNTPNNPTGRVLTEREARAIVELADTHDLLIISDEIYEKIIYPGAVHLSPASMAGGRTRTITVNGFSKAYAMTGWRLGYVAGPPDIMQEVLKATQHTVGCAGSFIQRGGLVALTGDQAPVRGMAATYAARRALVVDGLNAIPGMRCAAPDGAFYAFPNIERLRMGDSAQVTQRLLQRAGLVATPGTAFGLGGEGHIRLAFAAGTETLHEGLARIRQALT